MLIFIRCWLVCLIAALACDVACAAEVVLVFDDKLAGFSETADAVKQELARAGVSANDIVRVSPASLSEVMDWGRMPPRLMVTLGADALRHVMELGIKVPLLATLIPRLTYEHTVKEQARKWPAPVSAVFMDQPLGRQLDFIRLLMPKVRKVGVMWGAESSLQEGALLSAATARQMELVSADAKFDMPLASSLQLALDGADVLLALPDARVFNSGTISNILMASYRARVPVVAFAPAYVKAGAMAAIYTTPTQIGAQAGIFARALLQNSQASATQYPTDYVVGVNDRVARSLGFVLDPVSLLEKLKKLEHRP